MSAEGVSKLDHMALGLDQRNTLTSRLRQAPFFLSLRVITLILKQLQKESKEREGATLYDVYNAMTYLGSHEEALSHTYRMRLRLGAGEFTRHESRICETCRQLVLKRGGR